MKVIGFFDSRNGSTDFVLDSILERCIKCGIKSVRFNKSELCEGECVFNNGYTYKYWDRNKPYAWLIRGEFLNDSGTIFSYDGGMPTKRTMNKFAAAIADFLTNKITISKLDNTWWWGRCATIILNGGEGIVSVSVENAKPEKAFIHDLSVAAEKRGHGLGNELVREALRQAKSMGCEYAQLSAEKEWLVKWYERRGFKEDSFDKNVTYLKFEDLQKQVS